MKKFLSLVIFVTLTFKLQAQEMRVKGVVFDTSGTKPLPNTGVMAVRIKDSVLLRHTRTNINGEFSLTGFQVDTFTLYVEHPEYDTKTFFIFGSKSNSEIDIPKISLSGKSKQLKEVIVYANKNPIYFKGDTLVYVADSFKVGENAVVEDLLKKLPGIKVDENGTITSQGKQINQVLVDGDEFFGTDPTIATRNLGAKGVESVQIYEKEKENAKAGEEDKIQVLDLKLKEDAKKGYFGKFSAATDFGLFQDNPFYETEILANKFEGKQKISIFLLGSNTPKSNFKWGDMNKFGLENERNNSGMSNWNQGNTNNTSGIPRTVKAGIYYTDKIGKTGKIGFNYAYYDTRLDVASSSFSQYFLPDTTFFTKDSSNNKSTNTSHRINMNFSMNIDSLTFFELKPNVNFDEAVADNTSISEFIDSLQIRSLRSDIKNKDESLGITSNSEALLRRKFKRPKRELELKYILNYSKNRTTGQLLNAAQFDLVGSPDTTFRQDKTNENGSTNHYTLLTYTEPITERIKIQVEYLYEFGDQLQDKRTYDLDVNSGLYTSENTLFSNNFDNIRQQNRGTILGIYEDRKHTLIGGIGFRNIDITNRNLITDSVTPQNISNYLPQFSYQFKPSISKRFGFFYTTNSQQPSVNDLQPVQDNSNPNRIQEGNPDLKPNYVHNVRMNFNTWSALTGRYIWSGFNASLTNNAFANSTSFDSYGRTISRTENVDGNIFSNLFAGFGLPLFNRKFEINPNVNASYMRYTNIINDQENITQNRSISGGTEFELKLDSLQISVGGDYSYTSPVSSLASASNTPFVTQTYKVDFEWQLPANFKIKADAKYVINSQRTAGFNRNIFVVNTELSRSFLKTENLIITLSGNDLLNQNLNLQRQINGNIVTDNFTKIISRYFLLRLTYKFNRNKTKEEEWKGWY
ncbi:MAG: outer membrane beta-barrel protein [Bacteroidetes bacterium]|nr:outer membrane beta-barrel protein [Bacteroidota bacterium]